MPDYFCASAYLRVHPLSLAADAPRISLLREFAFSCPRESRAASTFCRTQLVGGEDRDQAAPTQSRAALPIEHRVVAVPRVVDLGPFVRATAAGAGEDVPPLLDGVVD